MAQPVKNGAAVRVTPELLKKYPHLAAKLGISEAPPVKGKGERVRVAKTAGSGARRFEVSWYSPRRSKRITYRYQIEASSKTGAIKQADAIANEGWRRGDPKATNFVAKEVKANKAVRKATTKKKACKKNLLGFGKKAKRRRAARARQKADVLEAKAALLRAKARRNTKAATKAKKKATKRPAPKKAAKKTARRAVKKGAKKNSDLRVLFAEARRVATPRQQIALTNANVDLVAAQTPRAKQRAVKKLARVLKAVLGRRPVAKANPGIWADVLGGLAGGAGYALAAAWVASKLKRSAKPAKENSAKKGAKAKRAKQNTNTPALQRIRRDFLGRVSSGKSLKLFIPPNSPKSVGAMAKLTGLRLANGKAQHFAKGAAWIGGVQHGDWRRMVIGLKQPFAVPNGLNPDRRYDYGEVAEIEYLARKPHLYGKASPEYPFYHKFGDEGGSRPHLILQNGTLALKGGGYGIKREGISN